MNDDCFSKRPWGTWLVLAMQPGYKVKKLIVEPGQSLSKQYHTHRDEYWVVLEGDGKVILDDEIINPNSEAIEVILNKGFNLKIPKQVIHKLTNTGKSPLVIIEVQVGESTEEGDIIRLD
jgi:mannose-6-phosphate isomerase-like protein (cupin superfamily)